MKLLIPLVALILLSACASTHQEERINAVKDFVEVNELEKTDVIRTLDQQRPGGRAEENRQGTRGVSVGTAHQDDRSSPFLFR